MDKLKQDIGTLGVITDRIKKGDTDSFNIIAACLEKLIEGIHQIPQELQEQRQILTEIKAQVEANRKKLEGAGIEKLSQDLLRLEILVKGQNGEGLQTFVKKHDERLDAIEKSQTGLLARMHVIWIIVSILIIPLILWGIQTLIK